jgi:hypothetical protein
VRILCAAAIVVVAALPCGLRVAAQAPREPPLSELLRRAGEYVQQLEHDFSVVIGDEQYEQKAVLRRGVTSGGKTRRTTSEMSFMWVPDGTAWISVRNVLRVDNQTVADSRARIDAAIADQQTGRASQLRRLRDEGARFNIGQIGRNFSDPMLGLQVMDPAFQSRFMFAVAGAERLRGTDTVRLTFVEHGHPTVIRRAGEEADLPSHGEIWIHAQDGVVHQTRLVTVDQKYDTRATITVRFAHDTKIERWVPQRMDEEYMRLGVSGGSSGTFIERIECVATYSNYRRFETSGRILPQ